MQASLNATIDWHNYNGEIVNVTGIVQSCTLYVNEPVTSNPILVKRKSSDFFTGGAQLSNGHPEIHQRTVKLFMLYLKTKSASSNRATSWYRDFHFANVPPMQIIGENVNKIFTRNSYGRNKFVGLFSSDVDVHPVWLPIVSDPSKPDCTNICNTYNWLMAVVNTVGNSTIMKYNHVVMMIDTSMCQCPLLAWDPLLET